MIIPDECSAFVINFRFLHWKPQRRPQIRPKNSASKLILKPEKGWDNDVNIGSLHAVKTSGFSFPASEMLVVWLQLLRCTRGGRGMRRLHLATTVCMSFDSPQNHVGTGKLWFTWTFLGNRTMRMTNGHSRRRRSHERNKPEILPNPVKEKYANPSHMFVFQNRHFRLHNHNTGNDSAGLNPGKQSPGYAPRAAAFNHQRACAEPRVAPAIFGQVDSSLCYQIPVAGFL